MYNDFYDTPPLSSFVRRSDKAIDCRPEYCPHYRCQPEQPKLRYRPVANKQRDTAAASWVHGGVGHRDANQVKQCETKSDS
jgi:hypothetical protein